MRPRAHVHGSTPIPRQPPAPPRSLHHLLTRPHPVRAPWRCIHTPHYAVQGTQAGGPAVAASITEFVAETAGRECGGLHGNGATDADWFKERLVMAVNLLDAGAVDAQASTPTAAVAWLSLLRKARTLTRPELD